MIHLLIYLFSVFIVLCSCTKRNDPKISEHKIVLENISSKTIKLEQLFDNSFPINKDQILNEIRSISNAHDLPIHIAAWIYVRQLTSHDYPPTIDEKWIHNPIIFLNSVGQGFCDDRASVMAIIWNWLGFETRVWSLTGHVVPEVLVNSNWQMLDPDEEEFYLNKKGEIASVNELSKNSKLIAKTKQNSPLHKKIEKIVEKKIASNHRDLARYYKTEEDNFMADWFTDISIDGKEKFILPPKTKLVFPIIYKKSSDGNRYADHSLKATIYGPLEQDTVQVPLVLSEFRKYEHGKEENVNQFSNLNYNYYNVPLDVSMSNLDSVVLYYSINKIMIDRLLDSSKTRWSYEGLQTLNQTQIY